MITRERNGKKRWGTSSSSLCSKAFALYFRRDEGSHRVSGRTHCSAARRLRRRVREQRRPSVFGFVAWRLVMQLGALLSDLW